MDDFTIVENVKLDDVGFIFRCYFAFLSAISIVCVANWLLKSQWVSFKLIGLINLLKDLLEFLSGVLGRLKRIRLNPNWFRTTRARKAELAKTKKSAELKMSNVPDES